MIYTTGIKTVEIQNFWDNDYNSESAILVKLKNCLANHTFTFRLRHATEAGWFQSTIPEYYSKFIIKWKNIGTTIERINTIETFPTNNYINIMETQASTRLTTPNGYKFERYILIQQRKITIDGVLFQFNYDFPKFTDRFDVFIDDTSKYVDWIQYIRINTREYKTYYRGMF